jgi:hypothetical protein
MPSLQITVTDETASQIKRLMEITGHERPGALINLLVRRYGQDLARLMSGDVLLPPEHVPRAKDIEAHAPVVVASPTEEAPPVQEVPTGKTKGQLFAEMEF